MEEKDYFNISEEYPATFDKQHFYGLRSFAERVRYCSEHLPKIAAGSGRVVFKVDDKTALKLAKNPKGIAQNSQEAQIGGDNYFQSVVAIVYNYDQDDKWIESELASKVNSTRFKELVGVDIKTVGYYLRFREEEEKHSSRRSGFNPNFTPEQLQELHNNQFLADIFEMQQNFTILSGDFGELSSYGEVVRDGHPTIVLVDYGLSDEVWRDHYERKPQNRPHQYYVPANMNRY